MKKVEKVEDNAARPLQQQLQELLKDVKGEYEIVVLSPTVLLVVYEDSSK